MKKIFTLLLLSSAWLSNAQTNFTPGDWGTSLTGYWTFENAADLGKAAVGTDLVINNGVLPFTQVAGPTASDKAIHKAFAGDNMLVTTGIGVNGGGSATKTNQYSIMFDFLVPAFVGWNCLISTDVPLSNDGDLYLKSDAIGAGSTLGNYPAGFLAINTWYRCIFTVDLTQAKPQNHVYINGVEKATATNTYAIDDVEASMDSQFYFLGDSDGEEDEINIGQLAVFNRALTAAEALTLGGATLATPKFSAADNSLKVYPNPVSSNARISFNMPSSSKNANIELIDMTGRVVENIYRGSLDQGEQTISWDLKSKYNAGTYLVKLSSENTNQVYSILMK